MWLRINGLENPAAIRRMLASLKIPEPLLPLMLDLPQHPRLANLEGAMLVVLHRLGFEHDDTHLISTQLGLLLLPGILISFDESLDCSHFDDLTAWLADHENELNQRDLDDVLHYLIDCVLDEIFPMLEHISDRLDDLESESLHKPRPKILNLTFQHRTNLRTIRSQIYPLRHQIRVMLRQGQKLIGPEAQSGFLEMLELVDLLFQHMELLRTQCDSITQAYAASVSNRMNQVMKTLTILTSIFAPMTFIAGVYGMNFKNMPELEWRHGYGLIMAMMMTIGSLQTLFLWRRGWFEDWTATR